MVKVQCPRCNARFEIPDSQAGQEEACPTCGHVWQMLPIVGELPVRQNEQTPVEKSWVEFALEVFGGLCFAIGGCVGLAFLDSESSDEPVGRVWAGVAFLGGLAAGMQWFFASLVLRYLRRITNAVEAKK